MSADLAKRVLGRLEKLKSGRANFDNLFQQIAERVLPWSASFARSRTAGEARTEKIFDATAALAVRKFATFLESATTPRNQRYHRLVAADDGINENLEVQRYLDELNKLLFRSRYAPTANFAGQVGQVRLELAAFGTSSMFIDEEIGYGIRYRAIPLAQTYFVENHVGLIDTVYREFPLSAANAVARYGDRCPERIRTEAQKHPDTEFMFVHCVEPNTIGRDQGLLREHKFQSITACEVGDSLVKLGGYYSFPYAISRDLTATGEIYGRSSAMLVLPDIKMLNEMNKTVVRAGQKALDPPTLLQEDGALSHFDFRPGAMNFGGIGPNGEKLAVPFESASRFDVGFELMQAKQALINEALYITLFQILVQNPKMTATEVLERAQEKGMLLGPLAGRDQSEFLGPMVEREISLHAEKRELPEMPDILAEAGGKYKVEYESPLAQAQRAQEGVAIMRTFEGLQSVAAGDPEKYQEMLDNYDLDEISRALGEINGMAAKLYRDRDAVDEIRTGRQQQQAAAMAAQAAPGVARAAKDLSAAA